MLGRVYQGEPVLCKDLCLAQGHNAVMPMRLNPAPLDLQTSTLPLSHQLMLSSWLHNETNEMLLTWFQIRGVFE